MDHSFLQNKKLLLVDDEPELLKMVTSILADDGFENIVTAVSVKEGISAVQKEKPNLVILDVMLRTRPWRSGKSPARLKMFVSAA